MIIDLLPVSGKDGNPLPFEGTVSFPNLSFQGGVLASQVYVLGEVKNTGGEIQLLAQLTATFHFDCARCLKSFSKPLQVRMAETVGKEDNQAYLKPENHRLDLTQAIYTHLLGSLSGKELCHEECKGLCIMCGADLNEGDCGCDRTLTDPRFDVLKELLNQTEGGVGNGGSKKKNI